MVEREGVTPEELFARYAPGVRELCLRLRVIVREELPDADEVVFAGYKNVSYGTAGSRTDADLICYIAPFTTSVNLGFFRGTSLPDPHGLLKGTGKSLRHVKYSRVDQIDEVLVRALLVAARWEHLGQ